MPFKPIYKNYAILSCFSIKCVSRLSIFPGVRMWILWQVSAKSACPDITVLISGAVEPIIVCLLLHINVSRRRHRPICFKTASVLNINRRVHDQLCILCLHIRLQISKLELIRRASRYRSQVIRVGSCIKPSSTCVAFYIRGSFANLDISDSIINGSSISIWKPVLRASVPKAEQNRWEPWNWVVEMCYAELWTRLCSNIIGEYVVPDLSTFSSTKPKHQCG